MKKLLVIIGIATITMLVLWTPVYAAGLDEITGSMVLETSAQANLYEEASDESKVVASLEAGTVVLTMENAENSWCKISAGEYTGYIKVEYLNTIGNQDLINQEFEQSMNENHKIYDEIQQLDEQKSKAEMRENIVLVVGIVVIAACGILIKKKSRKATENQP